MFINYNSNSFKAKVVVVVTLSQVGVTIIIARCFTMSSANDCGDVGFLVRASSNIQETVIHVVINATYAVEKKLIIKFSLNVNYYDVYLLVDGESRRNSVTLCRIPGDSDNSIVNSQVTKNLIVVTELEY